MSSTQPWLAGGRIRVAVLMLELLVFAPASSAQGGPSEGELARRLDFELPPQGDRPGGWGGGPGETLFADSTWFWSGHASGRLERVAGSAQSFSTFTSSIPAEYPGSTIVYRGYLRSESVEGWAGLWMRIDGDSGTLAFDNMQRRGISGTTEWARYEIQLPLTEGAKEIHFGALLSGTGKVWVDALEIEIDGTPIAEARRIEREPTPLDLRHDYDGGSGIELFEPSEGQIETLALLGRVWGFLKYHHPVVVGGEVHWDYALFDVLPPVLGAETNAARNAILVDWIDALGEVEPCLECASYYENPYMHAELEWVHDEAELGTPLAERLQAIRRNRPVVTEQFHVAQVPEVGNPIFRNERGYGQVPDSDAGYRILALYRFWNIIEYWYPYRDLIGEDWGGVLEEFLPRFARAPDSRSYRLEMMQLIARVNDTHANLWSDLELRPPTGDCGLGVTLRFLGDRCVVSGFDGAAENDSAELRLGDEILTLGGEAVTELVERYAPLYAASNRPTRLRDLARQITRGECGEVGVGIRRGDEKLALTLERVPEPWSGPIWHDRPGEAFQMLGEQIAYLKFSSAEAAEIPSYLEQAANTKGWILDLRNYPREFLVFALGGHFVEQPTDFACFTVSDLESPGSFYWSSPVFLTPAEPHYEGKLVILVDETTQSSAEYTSMAFRAAPGAMVVGSTTAAADGNVSRVPLPGGMSTMISGIGVFYPDHRGTQRVGVEVDLEVIPTVEGIRGGRDEVLEEAVRSILGDQSSDRAIQELLRH